MDAVSAIRQDHRSFSRLFQRLREGNGDRTAVVAEMKARLEAHSIAEETHVYPLLVRSDPNELDEVYHGIKEHHEAERLAAELQAADDDEFDDALEVFADAMRQHVTEEEREILPALERLVGPGRLEDVGREFDRRRAEELRRRGVKV